MRMIRFFEIQRLCRAWMLPIAVLPVAGLLLRLGQPDLLQIQLMARAALSGYLPLSFATSVVLPLLFAIGVATSVAQPHHGAAGLAGAIAYLAQSVVLQTCDASINMGALSGMTSGLVAGSCYNRFHAVHLQGPLAFLDKYFAAITSAIAGGVLGLVFGALWLQIQAVIAEVGHWLIGAGECGVLLYGVLNRLLLVAGLHHMLNSLVWFDFGSFTNAGGAVSHGDLGRFFAGDPSAGAFMTGFFPVMMFGLPAACLALYRCARLAQQRALGGLLLSMALTSFLTGITEPIEFVLMFLAPPLYAIHALLTGLSMALTHVLQIRLGFTFSAGLLDFLFSSGKGRNALWLLPVGALYFALYYQGFSFALRRFSLMPQKCEYTCAATAMIDPARWWAALGGASNVQAVETVAGTRLRVELSDAARADPLALKRLGAVEVVQFSSTLLHVVMALDAGPVSRALQSASA